MSKREQSPQLPEREWARQSEYIALVRSLPHRPRSYCIVTYGCQMNAHDSEQLAGMLAQMGLAEAEREQADLVLFNTCCIRDNAQRRALGNIQWLQQRKKAEPDLIVGVCGCMIQQKDMADRVLKELPGVDLAFGTHNLHRLPEYLYRVLDSRERVAEVWEVDGAVVEDLPVKRVSPIKAYVNVMYGCDNFCTYCIVPYVRGRERSRRMDDVLREAEGLLKDGVKEIMLLGQNVNSYGNDRGDGADFAMLLRELDALGVPRIRFMTSHPKDLSDSLIEAMAGGKGICRHIHLPVQSGSDRILTAMNRRYTAASYLERVAALRRAMPDIGITSDLIVGFPGETEADFADTLALVEAADYDAAYTFIYSPREGTRAASLPDPVPSDVATERIQRLIALQEAHTAAVYARLIGTEQTVLVEERSKRGASEVAGKCGRNITCNLPGDDGLIGQMVPVKIVSAGHNTLRAQPR